MKLSRVLMPGAVLASVALVLSGCAEGAADGAASEGGGFEFGASQEEVDELVADLEPVTLTYQASAGSPNSVVAQPALAFKEVVEERSNGNITVEIVWGQAIAGYDEIIDALNDGRIDIADHIPVYAPDEFPVYNALATSMSGLPNSPLVGEAVQLAVAAELGEQSEALRAEFEGLGVTPIVPLIPAGAWYGLCTSEDTSSSDWDGNQVRVSSAAHHELAQSIGATPVSMEWTETFEALQRGTVDCSMAQLSSSAEGGVPEVAPNIIYTSSENSLPSRAVAATLAGSSFDDLPLVYRQIIHDVQWIEGGAGRLGYTIDGTRDSVQQAKDANGNVLPFDEDVDQALGKANKEVTTSVRDTGLVSEELLDSIPDLAEKWESQIRELGYEDEGTIEDLDEWWEPGSVDFSELTEAIYTEVGLDNRPR